VCIKLKVMKNYFFIYFLGCSINCFSQTGILKQPKAIEQCQTKAEIATENEEIKRLKEKYYSTHKVAYENRAATHVLLGWPMRANSDYDFQYNYFNLQNYVDQNRESPTINVEYGCAARTYQGHDAQDINLFPFWWRMMDNNHVMAVAAAPGIILSRRDDNFDRNCTPTGISNRIVILHDDGTTTRYHHLKNNSLTTKPDSSRVEQGEFLGFIGSSGRSSNPHLHFAVYDALDSLIEPFFNTSNASCNNYSTETWWQNQRSYWEPQINRLMTHSANPNIQFCPDDEEVYAKNQFTASSNFYTGIAFMDAQDGDVAFCSLIKPNGDPYKSWNATIGQTNSRQYYTNAHLLPSGNVGTWVFRANYRSKLYTHYFTVGCKDNEMPSGTIAGNSGFITGNFIQSTATHTVSSTTRVLYQAANYVELKPGFEAKAGVHFKARIKGCDYSE
jgi:Peptidase family M23